MVKNGGKSIWEKSAVIVAIIACILSAWTSWNANEISNNANNLSQRALEIEEEAYEVILPFQKPIIYIEKTNVNSQVKNVTISKEFEMEFQLFVKDEPIDNYTGSFHTTIDTKQVEFLVLYNISNAGKGIAENFQQYIFIANFNDSSVQYLGKRSIADEIYPDNPISMEINFSFNGGFTEDIANGTDLGFIIRSEYSDLTSKEKLNQTSWGKLRVDCNKVLKMSNEEKELLLDSYNTEVERITNNL